MGFAQRFIIYIQFCSSSLFYDSESTFGFYCQIQLFCSVIMFTPFATHVQAKWALSSPNSDAIVIG